MQVGRLLDIFSRTLYVAFHSEIEAGKLTVTRVYEVASKHWQPSDTEENWHEKLQLASKELEQSITAR